MRKDFSDYFLDKTKEDKCWLDNIVFSDECSFTQSGSVNIQNLRIWGKEKPHIILQKPVIEKKLNVFVSLSSKILIGPYFF